MYSDALTVPLRGIGSVLLVKKKQPIIGRYPTSFHVTKGREGLGVRFRNVFISLMDRDRDRDSTGGGGGAVRW